DCLCVGQKQPADFRDEQVLLFLEMVSGKSLGNDPKASHQEVISSSMNPRHVPTKVFQVKNLPYTVNEKRIENLVQDIAAGKSV
ncbi:hypothetical protein DM02DRAFT_467717, partial [Periconia macrospinosa]